MRDKAMRRVLRAQMGSRTSRRLSTKVKTGSRTKGNGKGGGSVIRTRRPRPRAILNALERYLPPVS